MTIPDMISKVRDFWFTSSELSKWTMFVVFAIILLIL
jgi:hypothetical protein